jgi:hypothetical protein
MPRVQPLSQRQGQPLGLSVKRRPAPRCTAPASTFERSTVAAVELHLLGTHLSTCLRSERICNGCQRPTHAVKGMPGASGPKRDAADRVQDGDFVILQYGEGRYEKHRKILQVRKTTATLQDVHDAAGTAAAAADTLIRVGTRYVHPSALIGVPWGVRLSYPDPAEQAVSPAPQATDKQLLLALRTDADAVATDGQDVDAEAPEQRSNPSATACATTEKPPTLTQVVPGTSQESFTSQFRGTNHQTAATAETVSERVSAAQSKRLERKHQRHGFSLRVIRPSLCTLTDTLYQKMEGKSLWMHAEALGFVLLQAGVWAGTKRVLILEELAERTGLVTAACTQRMRYPGRVPNPAEGILVITAAGVGMKTSHGAALRILGLRRSKRAEHSASTDPLRGDAENASRQSYSNSTSEDRLEAAGLPLIQHLPLEWLQKTPGSFGGRPRGHLHEARAPTGGTVPPMGTDGSIGAENSGDVDAQLLEVNDHLQHHAVKRSPEGPEEREERPESSKTMDVLESSVQRWLDNADRGNEAIIIAFKEQVPGGAGDLVQLMALLLPLLSPGYPFVIWSPWLQPLAELQAFMSISDDSGSESAPVSIDAPGNLASSARKLDTSTWQGVGIEAIDDAKLDQWKRSRRQPFVNRPERERMVTTPDSIAVAEIPRKPPGIPGGSTRPAHAPDESSVNRAVMSAAEHPADTEALIPAAERIAQRESPSTQSLSMDAVADSRQARVKGPNPVPVGHVGQVFHDDHAGTTDDATGDVDLRVLQQVAHVRLTEITTFGHQFAAERTHPWMSQTPPSGFVLSGFRIQP